MFEINGVRWHLAFVPVSSPYLMRSDGSLTVGMTDGNTNTVYLCDKLRGAFKERVLCHELCHAVCFSWDIHIPIETEEWLCDFMSLHGKEIIYLLDDLLSVINTSRGVG